jgi:glycosyltransferase involved in cell wall biosynthesis
MSLKPLPSASSVHLMWVYPDCPGDKLDAATWLETARELRRSGWRVTLITAGPAGEQRFRGVDVLCFPKPGLYILRQAFFHIRLLRWLAAERPCIDVLLFHQMSAPWLLPLRLVRLLTGGRRPLLVMDTRTIPLPTTTLKERIRASFHRLMNRFANRWADGQTAITQRMAEAVRIPPQRLLGIWPSGVNPESFAPAHAARRWPSSAEPVRLVYVGALYPERNLLPLCRAVEEADAVGLAFRLTLVGDGPQWSELNQLALGAKGLIRVEGSVSHAHIPGLLSSAHVGVLPFPDEERFQVSSPIKLFEYMAAGLPIMATRIACHTDVVGGGQYVFWVEDANVEGLLATLRIVSRSRSSLEKMGRQAALQARDWTWRESARKLSNGLLRGLSKDASGISSVSRP